MFHSSPAGRLAALSCAALLAAGCTTGSIDDALRDVNADAPQFTQHTLELARTPAQRDARASLAADLLSRPLTQSDAVQLALVNSPAMQVLAAQGWAAIAEADQAGRPSNPVFSFERLRLGGELEIGRLLSLGLMDLVLLPRRQTISRSLGEQARLQLSVAVVDQVTRTRRAWVRAVANRQSAHYAEQVHAAAEASAELARRMQQAGNFSKLQGARQQLFFTDAITRLAVARHAATVAREDLVRALGLDETQARQLQLPERLPELPASPRDAAGVSESAKAQRLDLRLARARLDAATASQGVGLLPTFIDVGAGARRDSILGDGGTRGTRRGFELDIRLPLFDWGSAQRDALDAQALATANRYDATARAAASQLREDYSAYRTAYEIAAQYRDEIVPLRQRMAEENLLRYNGMLIGVFDLLTDAREQIAAVSGAIDAQGTFWLADAALSASMIGSPAALAASME